MYWSLAFFVWLSATVACAKVAFPNFIPAVHTSSTSGLRAFSLPKQLEVIVDEAVAYSTKDNGLTLIPPTLLSFASTFASDVEELFPGTSVKVTLGTEPSAASKNYIYLTILNSLNATFADGTPTTEGYTLNSSPSGIIIAGSGAKGAFWGTRTLLQGLVLSKGSFPSGFIADQPDWRTRGFMLGMSLEIVYYLGSSFHERCRQAMVSDRVLDRIVHVRFLVQSQRICE